MGKCDVCGNNYEKSFLITIDDKMYTFDSFECAIHKLAPTCTNCGCKIIGHGLQHNTIIYCSAHCARKQGISTLRDNSH